MMVDPPSTSLAPALAPAAAPVTATRLPCGTVPSCSWIPLLLVGCGTARSNRPEVALPDRVQPIEVSNESSNTTPPGGGGGGVLPPPQVGSFDCAGTATAFHALRTVTHSGELAPNMFTTAFSDAVRTLT